MFQFPSLPPNKLGPLVQHQRGLPHSDTAGSIGYRHLPDAFRRLSRPSSALITKASTICLFARFYLFFQQSDSLVNYFLLTSCQCAVDRGGFEPPTSALQMQCSSRLSYRPRKQITLIFKLVLKRKNRGNPGFLYYEKRHASYIIKIFLVKNCAFLLIKSNTGTKPEKTTLF